MEKIQTINEFAEALGTTVAQLPEHFSHEIYPVTIEYGEKALKLKTDADRVPFTKILRFPFDMDDYEAAIVGLQCVTDYAMHEGYDNTHKDLFKSLALHYAEEHGIIEYEVNKEYMEYWSLYDDGFHFYRVDLNTNEKSHVCHLEWYKSEGYPIPAFLLTEVKGFTKYNYYEG